LITVEALAGAVAAAPRTRHRAILLAAVRDIGQGAQALSEIDLARLCRRHGLPEPTRQAVRPDVRGQRRYLDAEWRRPNGRRVVAEVDGALHLVARRWWDDQFRQNELVISGRHGAPLPERSGAVRGDACRRSTPARPGYFLMRRDLPARGTEVDLPAPDGSSLHQVQEIVMPHPARTIHISY
jgi:hypothetical protein